MLTKPFDVDFEKYPCFKKLLAKSFNKDFEKKFDYVF